MGQPSAFARIYFGKLLLQCGSEILLIFWAQARTALMVQSEATILRSLIESEILVFILFHFCLSLGGVPYFLNSLMIFCFSFCHLESYLISYWVDYFSPLQLSDSLDKLILNWPLHQIPKALQFGQVIKPEPWKGWLCWMFLEHE